MSRGMDLRFLVEAYYGGVGGDHRVISWADYSDVMCIFRQALHNPRIHRAAVWQDYQGDRIRLESFNPITRARHRMFQA
jgi:hypothetical protein